MIEEYSFVCDRTSGLDAGDRDQPTPGRRSDGSGDPVLQFTFDEWRAIRATELSEKPFGHSGEYIPDLPFLHDLYEQRREFVFANTTPERTLSLCKWRSVGGKLE